MSWRNILGINSSTDTQNPQNVQKECMPVNNAYSASFASKESKLLDALTALCQNLPITPREVYKELSQEDVEDWHIGKLNTSELRAFARSLVQFEKMGQGTIPAHFTEHATCSGCGPIWLWYSGEVLGCCWCHVRGAGKPIPRPLSAKCNKIA
ncbi:hypothetical protein [Candidatus Berkiella aquae]|uniref:Uncharacterized protein n=1 Tax=Candidatus Berkiella aquae TaxID=295108 RepID=A0A0Q9YMF0_9GAMM|nr:hypothetical protein [Candidatus Berkiella aquae]MCS5710437.1 hypothetical protein [Candidatus Berkiella aquae]